MKEVREEVRGEEQEEMEERGEERSTVSAGTETTSSSQGGEEEWIVPGKYRDVEDVRRGIKETERYVKRLEKENKEMREMLERVLPGVGKEAEPEVDVERLNEEFLSSFNENPLAAIQAIVESSVREIIERELGGLKQSYREQEIERIEKRLQEKYKGFDFRENEELIAEELEKIPEEIRMRAPAIALEYAVIMAQRKKGIGEDAIERAKEEGKGEIKEKIKGSMTVGSSKGINKGKSPEEEMLEDILNASPPKNAFM